MRSDAGLSLIELLAAVLVLSIGILGAMRSVAFGVGAISGEADRLLAWNVAQNRAAEIRALGAVSARGLPEVEPQGRKDWRIDVTETVTQIGLIEVTIRVTGDGSAAVELTSYATAGPMPAPAGPAR